MDLLSQKIVQAMHRLFQKGNYCPQLRAFYSIIYYNVPLYSILYYHIPQYTIIYSTASTSPVEVEPQERSLAFRFLLTTVEAGVYRGIPQNYGYLFGCPYNKEIIVY